MEWINILGGAASVLGAFFALMAWLKAQKLQEDLRVERERQNKRVAVTLQYGSEKLELPIELQRAELTRAEILGRLGMIPMKVKGSRFSLGYLSKPQFFEQINQIKSGHGDGILTIPCTQEEFEQFDLK